MEQNKIVSPEWLVAGRSDILVDGTLREGWGVRPAPLVRGASYTDFSEHEMAVPSGDTLPEEAVRLHELIHARISPTRVPAGLMEQLGAGSQAVKLAEEVRVNLLGRVVGENVEGTDTRYLIDGSEQGLADSAVERDSWQDAINLFLTTYNTDAFRTVKRRLRRHEEWKEPLRLIEKSLKETGWRYDENTKFRKKSIRNTTPTEYRWYEGKKQHLDILPDGFVVHTMPLANKIQEWLDYPPAQVVQMLSPKKSSYSRDRGEWAELRFGITSLVEPTTSFLGRRKRPAMVGKYPSRPDRMLTDPERRIFREVVRSAGGVVVFDCSGSMGIDHETVREVVKQYSGATIVVYSNTRHNAANAWVVADNGRMITEEDFGDLPLRNGNGVDLPILRWAMRKRRTNKDFVLWVSDGQVTGQYDSFADNLLRDTARYQEKNNIIGVANADEALQLLSDMKRGAVMPRNKFVPLIQRTLDEMKGN
jgi:hypothetical protein